MSDAACSASAVRLPAPPPTVAGSRAGSGSGPVAGVASRAFRLLTCDRAASTIAAKALAPIDTKIKARLSLKMPISSVTAATNTNRIVTRSNTSVHHPPKERRHPKRLPVQGAEYPCVRAPACGGDARSEAPGVVVAPGEQVEGVVVIVALAGRRDLVVAGSERLPRR